MAEQLVSAMAMQWDPTEHTDTYRKDVLKLVDDLAKGKKPGKVAAKKPEDEKVIDLMAALRKSVEATGRAARKSAGRARRATARTRATARKRA